MTTTTSALLFFLATVTAWVLAAAGNALFALPGALAAKHQPVRGDGSRTRRRGSGRLAAAAGAFVAPGGRLPKSSGNLYISRLV